MVSSTEAREDVDNVLLTKTIIYRRYSAEITNLQYDTIERKPSESFSIKAQVTVQNFDSDFVSDGRVQVGDLVGLFRFEYDEDANGNIISPILVPKMQDSIIFNDKIYVIKSCTPATSEDSGIIAWDFTGGYSGDI